MAELIKLYMMYFQARSVSCVRFHWGLYLDGMSLSLIHTLHIKANINICRKQKRFLLNIVQCEALNWANTVLLSFVYSLHISVSFLCEILTHIYLQLSSISQSLWLQIQCRLLVFRQMHRKTVMQDINA